MTVVERSHCWRRGGGGGRLLALVASSRCLTGASHSLPALAAGGSSETGKWRSLPALMAPVCCRRRGSVLLAAGCGGGRLCAVAERLRVVSVLSLGGVCLAGGRRSPPALAVGTCRRWWGVRRLY